MNIETFITSKFMKRDYMRSDVQDYSYFQIRKKEDDRYRVLINKNYGDNHVVGVVDDAGNLELEFHSFSWTHRRFLERYLTENYIEVGSNDEYKRKYMRKPYLRRKDTFDSVECSVEEMREAFGEDYDEDMV